MDDDAWVRRLREVVSSDHLDAPPGDAPREPDAVVVRTAGSADVLHILRDLERRLTALEDLVGRLPTEEQLDARFDALADAVAAAVVRRLDARWTGSVDEV